MNRPATAILLATALLVGSLTLALPLAAGGPGNDPRASGAPSIVPGGDAGTGWIQDRYISYGYAVDIAPARGGELWAALSYFDAGTSCGDGVDLYSSPDGGYAWTWQATINDCAVPWFYHYRNASIAVDISTDRVYVAFERNDSTVHVVHGDPVSGWTLSALPPSGGLDTNPDIAAENDQGLSNRVYVASVWDVGAGDNIALIYTEDDGASWTWQDVASAGPPDRNQPSVAYANGWLWIAYNFVGSIGFANSNVGLGTPFTINSDILAADCASAFVTCQWPEVAVTRDGAAGAIVYEYNSPSADIDVYGVGSGDNGATWSPSLPIATTASSQTAPSLTVDYMTSGSNAVTGLFHIVYVDNAAIYHRTVDPFTLAFGPLAQVSDTFRSLVADNAYRTSSTTQLRGGEYFPVIAMIEPGTPDSVYATTPGWTTTIDTIPTGLAVVIDGVGTTAPFTASWPANSTHQVNVTSPQLETPGSDRYVFDRWDSTAPQNHTWTAPSLADAQETATFLRQWWIVVDTDPSGLEFFVDGIPATVPFSGWWYDASSHSLDVTPLQPVIPGERFAWRNWSDSGAQGHDVTANGAASYVARFARELQVDIATDPPGVAGVTVDSVPGAGTFWWSAGEVHALEADAYWTISADERRPFGNWSDGDANASRNYTVQDLAPGAPENLTANYLTTEYRVSVTSAPTALAVQVDSQWAVTPQSYWWLSGSSHTLTMNATQAGWAFSEWLEDGSTSNSRTVTVAGPANWTANHTIAPLSVTAAGTPDSGTAPLTVSFTATALGGTGPYAYAWDFGDGATGTGADVTHTYAAPGTYQANVTATDAATETAGTAVTIVVAAPPLLLDRCTVTPNPAVVAPGGTQAFTATGFTAANTEIPGATAAWTVTSGLGTISSAGLFTAGSGTGSGEVNATVSYNALSRTCSAAITVQEPTAAPLWPILLVLILVVVLLLLAMWWRRRKPAESPSEPPTYGSIDGGEAPTTLPESAPDDLATRLGRLKDARDKGLLSEEEYLAKREELLRQV